MPMKKLFVAIILFFLFTQTIFSQQSKPAKTVGDGCEGCELYEAGMPANLLSWQTTIGQGEKGEKLQINGVIFKKK
jgi:hypothetical protein